MTAADIAIHAAADAARRAKAATGAQAAALLEASGSWNVLADLLLIGARLHKVRVREHARHADEIAARAGELAPPAHEAELIEALFPRR